MKLKKEKIKKYLFNAMWFIIGVLITKIDIKEIVDFIKNLFD